MDGIKTLLTDLPDAPVTPARHRKIPALDSSAMKSELEDTVAPLAQQITCQSKISNIPFDDNVEQVKPVGQKLRDNIFCVDDNQEVKSLPSISVNPKRFESHLFDDPSPFKPGITLDPQRFKSNFSFGDEQETNKVQVNPKQSHLQSHIFDPASSPIQQIQAKVRSGNESHFSLAADDECAPAAPIVKPSDRNCAGHLVGSGLFTNENEEAKPIVPRSCNRNSDHFEGTSFEPQEQPQQNSDRQSYLRNTYNQSHISFADQDPVKICPPTTKSSTSFNAASAFRSQVCFDDEAPLPKPVPSSRITQPPGGHSQISFF